MASVEDVKATVDGYLRQSGLEYDALPDGAFSVLKGSTAVVIEVGLLHNATTVVTCTAPVALDCQRLTPEVGFYLAQENQGMLFGRLSIDLETKTVWCSHVLLGDYLDPEELITALATVVIVADDYDDRVADMAGGRRFSDPE